jgi:hypothetical protein
MNQLSAEWGQVFEDLELDWSEEWDALDEAAPEFSRRTGFPFLGGGNTRMVFALDDRTVLKLAYMGDSGAEANLHECEVWAEWSVAEPEESRRWLAPVVDCASGGEWLVMERAAAVTRDEVPPLNWGSVADQALGRMGIADAAGGAQWGRLSDGRVVLVDYGGGGW